jgi:hypothetical protein
VLQGRLFGMGQSKANQLSLSRFMVYCASDERRHHVWPLYDSPMRSPARRSSWT